ncbi:MAG: cobalamin-binding protein [candidate division WOR-3 bacterium]
MWKRLVYLICLLNPVCEKSFHYNELRIVSLSPAMTEIIFALGAENYLVGTTTYCDFPDSAKKIYKVGDFSNPSIERIISLKPNLIIVNLPEQSRIKNQLEKYGLKIFVTSPEKLEDIYKEISELGKLIKREKNADSLINYMKENIRPLSRIKKKVYIEISAKPLITIGGRSYLNELIEMAGGENIFSNINKDYPVVNQEEVIMRNPEIIIVLHPEDIKDRIGWNNVNAIKNHRIYRDLNQDWILRPGPRLVLGFEQLEKIFE